MVQCAIFSAVREMICESLRNDKSHGRRQATVAVQNNCRWIANIWVHSCVRDLDGGQDKRVRCMPSNAISSDDMTFSRLGSSTLVLVMHGTSSAPPSYFKGNGENKGTGLKELPGRELRSGVRRSSSFSCLPTPNGSCGSSGG